MLPYLLLDIFIHVGVDNPRVSADVYLRLEVVVHAHEGVQVVRQLLQL